MSYTRDSFTAKYLNRRGNRSVPKKYLKTAQWALIDNEEGYYCHHNGFYYPIEFNYDQGYWCYVTAGTFTRLGLCRLPYDKALVSRVLSISHDE
jgi:hypothetical protein